MADFSGFMTALGQGFTGYGKDQALRDESDARDQAAQQRAVMQKAQLDKLTREAQVSQVIQANWQKAVTGDQQAIGAIAAVHPQLAATLTKEPPKPQYDSERGVMVNPDATFTPIKGLPQKPQKDVKDHFTFVTGTGPDGKPIIYRFNTSTGQMEASDVGKPMGGQGGTALRAQDYADLMKNALPVMQELQGKVRPWAISGALKNPTIGNIVLTPDERRYIASARDYLAGVLHAESGARLTHEQLQFGQSRYLPVLGDDPHALQTKLQNAAQTYQDRAANSGGVPSPRPTHPPTAQTGQPAVDPLFAKYGLTPKGDD